MSEELTLQSETGCSAAFPDEPPLSPKKNFFASGTSWDSCLNMRASRNACRQGLSPSKTAFPARRNFCSWNADAAKTSGNIFSW